MIEFEQVHHDFGAGAVLQGVSLRIPEQRVALVGANGSGKSTLARMLNGLVHPTSGTVTVDGRDPVKQGRQVRQHVGFLFTNPDSQIVMPTAGEDVAFSLRRSGLTGRERAQRAQDILAAHGLGEYVEHPAHELSGGQKQLLALCSMLAVNPRVLVCDEPTTLLDHRNTRHFLKVVSGLSQQVVLVTHDLDLLVDFERVIVLDEGRVVADDAPAPALATYRELLG